MNELLAMLQRDGGNNGPPSDTQGNKENFEEVTKLISSDRYKTIMKQVHDYLKEAGEQLNSEEDGSTGEPSYQYVCLSLCMYVHVPFFESD